MHSLHSELKQLHTDGAVDDRSFAHLHELDKGTVFSVFYELRVVLYLAVLLIVAGAGMLLKDNLDRIGHVAIAVAIGVIAAICYYHAVRKQLKGESRSIVGDYVLLLGALLLSADTAFIETEFHLLQNHWALYLPLLAVIHAATAYILESRLVLSVSVAALAGWFGVSHHVDDLFFEYGELWTRGLQALECSAVVLGWRIANSKIGGYPQFNEVLDNYAINLGFWAGLIWCQADSSILYGVLVVTILSVVVIRNGLTNRSEWFVVYGVVYSAIAICIVAARLIDDALLTALVVLSSVIGVAVLLWRIHAQLKEKST